MKDLSIGANLAWQIAAMEAGLQGYIEILKSREGTGLNLHCSQVKH
jgi:hypothetical protein